MIFVSFSMKKTRKSPLMKKSFILSILLIFSILTISAQTKNEVFVVDALVCDSTGTGIKDVAIYDAKNNLRSVTDRDGIARIATRMGETLYFSHLSFKKQVVRIADKSLIDNEDGQKSMLVVMQHKTNILAEVTVTENAPQLAYENKLVWVVDYKVQHDGLYMLAGNGMDYCLLHTGFEQDTISRKPIAPKFQELYRDAFGNLHVLGPDSTYQVYCDGKELHLIYGIPNEVFNQKLKSIVAATPEILVMEERFINNQQIRYTAFDKKEKTTRIIRQISSANLEMAVNWQLDDHRLKLANGYRRGHYDNEVDSQEEDMLDFMFNVKKRLMLKPIYSPLFILHDELIIFDFENGFLCHFDQKGAFKNQVSIDFHKRQTYLGGSLDQKGWSKEIVIDDATGQFYAKFTSNGIVTLKEIDLADGKPKREIRLSEHTFPQNIQIYNGGVYYLFLDKTQTAGSDRRSLYKMRLR